MIAVLDCRNRHDDVPDTIDVYPDTEIGRRTSRQQFKELVAADLVDARTELDGDMDKAVEAAEEFLNPEGSVYTVGDGYIAMIESGVTLHE